jgi:hypothetical protein
MLTEFDQSTIANMTAALGYVCRNIPPENGTHDLRKRIGDAMIACAKSGKRTFVDFQNAGSRVVVEVNRSRKFDWLGLARLIRRK